MNSHAIQLSDRIGLSTIEMYDKPPITLDQAIDRTLNAGFRCIELHLDSWQGCLGDPYMIANPGVYPREFSARQIDTLAKKLEPFQIVTVHGTPYDINIAADNPGIREESVRQYLEAIDFANAIGASVCTFHPGRSKNVLIHPDVDLARHIEFAKRAAERLEKYQIVSGFENVPGRADPQWYKYIIEQVGSPKFGMLLDFGHAVMGLGRNTETLLEYISVLGEYICEVHVHQVLHWTALGNPIDHQPLDKGWGYDVPVIFEAVGKLPNQNFPIIFEIMGPRFDQMIENSLQAKEMVLQYWTSK